MMEPLQILNYVTIGVGIISGSFLGYRLIFKGRNEDDSERFNIMKESIEARDQKIDELIKRVDIIELDNKNLRELNIKLTAEKQLLIDSLKGTDYLLEIMHSIKDFEAFAKQAREDHQAIIQGMTDVKDLFQVNKRNADRKRPS